MRYIFLASPLKALDFSKVKIHRTLRSSEKANKNRTHKMGTKGKISILCRFLSSSTETLIRTSIHWWSAKKEKHMFPEVERKPRNAISFGVNQKRKYLHQTPDSEESKSIR